MADRDLERERGFTAGMLTSLMEGGISVPFLLLKYYHRLGITDAEAMLVLQILGFREKEDNGFPTIEELQQRMAAEPGEVIRMLQRLMKMKLLDIEEGIDPTSNIQYEKYSLAPLFMLLATVASKDEVEQAGGFGVETAGLPLASAAVAATKEDPDPNMFQIFEQEFGRPLSPMEVETMNGWLDQDNYSEPLIMAALKEAVFAGKVHFRYIDRILLDWNRNNIHTIDQAKEYSQKFRGAR